MNIVVRIVAALVMTIAAVVGDMRSYKIKNGLIIAGLIMGVGILTGELVMGAVVLDDELPTGYVWGCVMAFIIMFIAYLFRGIGAGDVKLMAVLGLLTGWEVVSRVIVVSFAAAGIMGIISLIKKKSRIAVCSQISGKVYQLHSFHFSPAILIGEIIVIGAMLIRG